MTKTMIQRRIRGVAALILSVVITLTSAVVFRADVYAASIWDVASTHHIVANGGVAEVWAGGQKLGSSGTIPANSIIVIGNGTVAPDNLETFSTQTPLDDGTVYTLTSAVNYSVDGLNVHFTPGTDAGTSDAGSEPSEPQYTEAQRAYAAYHDHAHNGNFGGFVWKTAVNASDYSDGIEEYRCPDCGYVLYSIPASAFSVFNRNLSVRIQKAPKNTTISIKAGQWISFHRMVIEAMQSRPDLTYELEYTYNHTPYILTIPAGTDLSGILKAEDNYAGFLQIAAATKLIPVTK